MDSSDKKISFGFSKISKKPILLSKPEERKVELIDCLEGQNIKLRNAIEVEEKLLIIPLEENKRNLVDRIKEIQEKRKTDTKVIEEKDTRPDAELSVDELAARELLREAQSRLNNGTSDNKSLTLSLKTNQDSLLTEGKEEPTLEDYEKIPINDFGLAMLRGMGWKEGTGIGKTPTRFTPAAAPELRPKGLGLGATKMLKEELPKEATRDGDGKILVLKKGSFVKIIAGSHKGQYCEVQGLDEESARVIVKTALKADVLTINESLLLLVTKEEYLKNSKVINSDKYNEYKEKECKNRSLVEVVNDRTESRNSNDGDRISANQETSNGGNRYSQSAGRNRSRKTDSDSDSSYESQSEKCNKVHKRKDKRRHRDRSRSPPSYRHKNGKKSKSRHRSSSSDSEYEKRVKERSRHHKEKKGKKNKR